MQRYHFTITDGTEPVDEFDQVIEDLASVRRHAMVVAADHTLEPEMLSEDGGAIIVKVSDEARAPVFTMRLAFSISIE